MVFFWETEFLIDHSEVLGEGVRVEEVVFINHIQIDRDLTILFSSLHRQKILQTDWTESIQLDTHNKGKLKMLFY